MHWLKSNWKGQCLLRQLLHCSSQSMAASLASDLHWHLHSRLLRLHTPGGNSDGSGMWTPASHDRISYSSPQPHSTMAFVRHWMADPHIASQAFTFFLSSSPCHMCLSVWMCMYAIWIQLSFKYILRVNKNWQICLTMPETQHFYYGDVSNNGKEGNMNETRVENLGQVTHSNVKEASTGTPSCNVWACTVSSN